MKRCSLLIPLVCALPSSALAQAITPREAHDILFGALPDPDADRQCENLAQGDLIPCLLQRRYATDPKAAQLAVKLWEKTGSLAGVLPECDFDGGYRGDLHFVPHLPVAADRKHLQFVSSALLTLDEFFSGLEKEAGRAPRYRWRNIELRFFRSVNRRTPAAYASGWLVAYNVRGTLNHSTTVVRNLLFHEIFHLNDQAARDWSYRALGSIHRQILETCPHREAKCLEPYARGWLKVRNRTYYAFMPGNGVEEYAAELALDYLREQLAVLAGRRVKHPFKCGPPQNAKAWKLIVDEFFAGVDRVPACSTN